MPIFDTEHSDRIAECLREYAEFIGGVDLEKCKEHGLFVIFQDLDAMFGDFVRKAPEERTEADIGRANGLLKAMESLCAKCMKEKRDADI